MRRVLPVVLIVVAFAFSIAVYSRLPEQVPTHWDWDGRVNGYSNRLVGAFLAPTLALFVWTLLRFLPRIDPRRANYEKFAETYEIVVFVVVAAVVLLHGLALSIALGWPVPFARIVPIGLAVLCIVVGNVLPRIRPNWWLGIRTPWTLSSDTVWAKTHRAGGYLLIGAGVVMAVAAFLPRPASGRVTVAAFVLSALCLFVYSYLAWRKEQSS